MCAQVVDTGVCMHGTAFIGQMVGKGEELVQIEIFPGNFFHRLR